MRKANLRPHICGLGQASGVGDCRDVWCHVSCESVPFQVLWHKLILPIKSPKLILAMVNTWQANV
jgi:hypothetical protein